MTGLLQSVERLHNQECKMFTERLIIHFANVFVSHMGPALNAFVVCRAKAIITNHSLLSGVGRL